MEEAYKNKFKNHIKNIIRSNGFWTDLVLSLCENEEYENISITNFTVIGKLICDGVNIKTNQVQFNIPVKFKLIFYYDKNPHLFNGGAQFHQKSPMFTKLQPIEFIPNDRSVIQLINTVTAVVNEMNKLYNLT